MISDRYKLFLFKQLYKELSNIEIIPYKDNIYFIDRDKKYWYFEYEKCGRLWLRYDFFNSFFSIFSLEYRDYEKVIGDWVEEVLNHKVSTTRGSSTTINEVVEEVLNHKVSTTKPLLGYPQHMVEEVLKTEREVDLKDSTN